jgi:hypothetical protein
MTTRSIANPDLFRVADVNTHVTYYGCNQEWYPTEWQRRSGCGPSVASNIILYLSHAQAKPGFVKNCSNKEKCISVMEEMWESVTPTLGGIPSTQIFSEAMLAYMKAKGLKTEHFVYDVPDNTFPRPALPEVVNFIEAALIKDVPVAFLNLCNGDEKKLSSWHWVTIISIEYAERGNIAFVNVLDEGLIKRINLSLWYTTTTLGGGFVYFTVSRGNDDDL